MAASDSDQDTSSLRDTSEMSLTTAESKASQINQTNNLTIFHCYIHLPFELRAQIRTAAIQASRKSPKCETPRTRLALVSREWQDDVERALFSQIKIDPSDEEDVATFNELFTDKRKRFLTRLDIAMDDDIYTSPWHKQMGLVGISQVMEKVGQFFQYLNRWDFCREDEKLRSIEVIFVSSVPSRGYHPPLDGKPHMDLSSFWDKRELRILTKDGFIPTNMALWVMKSEFPSALTMITHLTFNPDCVPLSAAQKIIQAMPNLETCVFSVGFPSDSGEAWSDLTDFIHQLHASVPALRKLTLHSRTGYSCPFVPPSMERFAAVLRDYSQNLECLRATPFDMHEAFFPPFSEGPDCTFPPSKWKWPRLQHLELGGFSDRSHLSADPPTITATDILIAAGTAATAMPALETAEIETEPQQYFYFRRDPYNGMHGFRDSSMSLAGFNEEEEQRILTAWAHLIGAETRLVEQTSYGTRETPMRQYRTVVKEGTGS